MREQNSLTNRKDPSVGARSSSPPPNSKSHLSHALSRHSVQWFTNVTTTVGFKNCRTVNSPSVGSFAILQKRTGINKHSHPQRQRHAKALLFPSFTCVKRGENLALDRP